jgi:hypothetical protein
MVMTARADTEPVNEMNLLVLAASRPAMKKVLSPSSETKTSENACTKPLRVASRVLAASERDRGTSATAAAAGRAWDSSAMSAMQAAAAVLPPSLRASALSKLCAERECVCADCKLCVKSAVNDRAASKASLRHASERCWNGAQGTTCLALAIECVQRNQVLVRAVHVDCNCAQQLVSSPEHG